MQEEKKGGKKRQRSVDAVNKDDGGAMKSEIYFRRKLHQK